MDVQERRIYHLQAELREGEAKLEQKQSSLQQLKEELETTKKLHKEVQKQVYIYNIIRLQALICKII